MELTFTKEQRHSIYKRALRAYKLDIKYSHYLGGLCHYCRQSAKQEDYLIADSIGLIVEALPELFSKKPFDAGMYWWDRRDTVSRINVLNQCIKETKPCSK